MLFEFLTANRQELIVRTRAKVAQRLAPRPTERELTSGVPLFLDQLAETLRVVSQERPPAASSDTIGRSAAVHGAALLTLGYTVAQVVHDYGDICQAITELADARHATITVEEFQILNGC